MADYYFTTEKELLQKDQEKIWQLLKNCFWSKNIPLAYVARFINYSLCFGIYEENSNLLMGFGRVISDYTTYAYVCDIVIAEEYRTCGIGNALINQIMSHPELQGLKTWSLRTTEEARKLYQNYGFKIADQPETQLEINDLEIYSRPTFVNLHQKTYQKLNANK